MKEIHNYLLLKSSLQQCTETIFKLKCLYNSGRYWARLLSIPHTPQRVTYSIIPPAISLTISSCIQKAALIRAEPPYLSLRSTPAPMHLLKCKTNPPRTHHDHCNGQCRMIFNTVELNKRVKKCGRILHTCIDQETYNPYKPPSGCLHQGCGSNFVLVIKICTYHNEA